MEYKRIKLPNKTLRQTLAAPFIFGMIVPIVFLDITIEIYHRIAFPLYGIPVNKRSNYIRIDRHKLSYLKTRDKLWCIYCGYANGISAYCVKIAGDTEKYWCSIKHKSGDGFVEPVHHKYFLEYGDETAYRNLDKQ